MSTTTTISLPSLFSPLFITLSSLKRLLSTLTTRARAMLPPLSPVDALLQANNQWATHVDKVEPTFFAQSTKGQFPKVLWIGCADSRVPESVLTASKPGAIFVHRNIANQFHPDDDNALSVLTYAITTVGVEHVILAGHTHCGGAAACYQSLLDSSPPADTSTSTSTPTSTNTNTSTPLDRWLTPLTQLISDLDSTHNLKTLSPSQALDAIVDANVLKQVDNICHAEPVRKAWEDGRRVWVHGWVYDVGTGRIRDLKVSRGPTDRV